MNKAASTRSANGSPLPSDPDLIETEPAPPWLWPPIVVLAATGCAVGLIVLPLLAGPPSRSEPWQALAWLPLGILALSPWRLGSVLVDPAGGSRPAPRSA